VRLQYTQHAEDVLAERKIRREWVLRVVVNPARTASPGDGTKHYLARIREHGNRVLRVVVNPGMHPPCVVTVFFDRRMKGKLP
jgi:hypothetical protein